MTEPPINNESGTADVKWDSPRQTEPLLTLLITHSYNGGADQSVQRGGVAGGTVKMEGHPMVQVFPWQPQTLCPCTFSAPPTAWPCFHCTIQRKMPLPSPFQNCKGFLWGRGDPTD